MTINRIQKSELLSSVHSTVGNMDLLKGLIFLLSFYICLSTAAVVSGIEELEEEEGKIQLISYFVLLVLFVCLFVCLMVLNATFNYISVAQ